jgi:hypothetical protein
MRKHMHLYNRLRALERRVLPTKEKEREDEKYMGMAFESLTESQKAMVLRATGIMDIYDRKATIWENQPEAIKANTGFYKAYMTFPKRFDRHIPLMRLMMSEEENKLVDEMVHLMSSTADKFKPRRKQRGIEGLH